MAQDRLTDAANTALMRAAPINPPRRHDFVFAVNPTKNVNCQLHYTYAPVVAARPVHPGPAPVQPVAPAQPAAAGRGRPNQARRTLLDNYRLAQIAYATAFAAHPAALQAHTDAVAAYDAAQAAAGFENDDAHGAPDSPVNRPDPDFIFTHGKGSRLDNPAVVAFCEGFARNYPLLAFEDAEEMPQRVTMFRALMNAYPMASALGGRSMGARASCRAAIYSPVKKLIFFTYPLTRDLSERYEELLALEADVEVLFVVGDADPMCIELLLKPLRARMRAKSWWLKMVKADHNCWYEDPIRGEICGVAGQIAALWNIDRNRDPELTELTLQHDAGLGHVTWTGWTAPGPEAPREPVQFNIAVRGAALNGGGGNFQFAL